MHKPRTHCQRFSSSAAAFFFFKTKKINICIILPCDIRFEVIIFFLGLRALLLLRVLLNCVCVCVYRAKHLLVFCAAPCMCVMYMLFIFHFSSFPFIMPMLSEVYVRNFYFHFERMSSLLSFFSQLWAAV